MSMISQHKYKFYRPFFSINSSSSLSYDQNASHRGYYQNKEITVLIFIECSVVSKEITYISIRLDAVYNGYNYMRTYNKPISVRQLQLLCNKFCKDIINNKVKNE